MVEPVLFVVKFFSYKPETLRRPAHIARSRRLPNASVPIVAAASLLLHVFCSHPFSLHRILAHRLLRSEDTGAQGWRPGLGSYQKQPKRYRCVCACVMAMQALGEAVVISTVTVT